jgi:hypothetical protein
MKLDHMGGDEIRKMVQDFAASQQDKGSIPVNTSDPVIDQYHRQQDNLEKNNPNYNYRPRMPNMEEDSTQVPEVKDTIRTRKMQMEGVVEKIGTNSAGYEEVFFRVGDGRLMKTPMSNVIVITKLADDDMAMMEQELNEISNEVLTKYKTAAADDARKADKEGDTARGNKRFSGIIKATKKQFDNDKKGSSVKEGGMGGINRCAPAQDVSYKKVLDRNPKTAHSEVVGEEQVNELSVDKMQAYKQAAASADSFRHRPLRKLAKSSQNVDVVNNKIAKKNQGPSTYQERLEEFLELDEEFNTDDFSDILNKQHVEKQASERKPTKDIPYHNWVIRYRPAAAAGQKVAWQIMDKKGDIKHKGESMSDKEAVGDAEEWVNQGGGTKQESSSNVTIDFNVDFAKQFAPGGERFYATIDSDNGQPVLFVSTEAQQGFKNSHIRTQKDKTTANTTQLPVITMSARESNAVGLQPNGRYLLGDKDPIDDNTAMFPLIFQGVVQGKGDMMKMGKPGLTVAHPREVTVHEGSSTQGTEDLPFSELVQDTIRVHGVKWAFDYYVRKHGIPARQFKIFAGL